MSAKITTTELAAIITSGNAVIVEALKGLTMAIQGTMVSPVAKATKVVKINTATKASSANTKLEAKLNNAKQYAASTGDVMVMWELTSKAGKVAYQGFRQTTNPSAFSKRALFVISPNGEVKSA